MAELVPAQAIVSVGLEKASRDKIKLAKKWLTQESALYGMNDPSCVSPRSTELIVDLLYKYSGLSICDNDPSQLKSREAVGGMITGLRWVYRDHGHIDSWSVRVENGLRVAHGNPCEDNCLLYQFRQSHAKKLSEVGKVVRSAPPLFAKLVIEHGKRFLCSTSNLSSLDKHDVMLHASFSQLWIWDCDMTRSAS